MITKSLKVFSCYIILLLIFYSEANQNQNILMLTKRQVCDLELIMNKGFAPLKGFMTETNYNSVVEKMRLEDNTLWPIPIVLDVTEEFKNKIQLGSTVILKSPDNLILAELKVEDIYKPNKNKEAKFVYGTKNIEHPGVQYLYHQTKDYYIGGIITPINLPKYYDFTDIRKTPEQLKNYFKERGYEKVVAFQTRNPMHRAHLELTYNAAKYNEAHLLIHPVVGLTKPGDIDYFTRVKCYKEILKHYEPGSATLSLLPLSMRMAGPREALWHAIIRKNYGCTHFIIGRDHAGPGKDSLGNDFYGPYDAQNMLLKYSNEIGIIPIPFKEMVYVEKEDIYKPIDEIMPGEKFLTISGTQLRKKLLLGEDIPHWFTFPEIVRQLQIAYPPQMKKGFTIFFTGLSGSGKTTIANALAAKLMELQDRPVTILDGDYLRDNIFPNFGFSKEGRSKNIKAVGFIANEISKNHGIAICSLIAPYAEARFFNRQLITGSGCGYFEVYISTPLSICQERDPKGLYAKVKEGKITNFTGIDDPYEAPVKPEITIDTMNLSVQEVVEKILEVIKKAQYF